MADRKIFAGARLRRLRQRLGLSQTQMAAEIGVSPSYLNLIERNQRPLTVQVLLKLSRVYGVDVAELSGEDGAGAIEALKEIFADPLLAGEIASPAELSEFVEAAPNAARGMARLFQAWRESLERLSDLSHRMAREGEAPTAAAARLPAQGLAAYFEEAGPYFHEIEEAAETLAAELSPRDDPMEALRRRLCGYFQGRSPHPAGAGDAGRTAPLRPAYAAPLHLRTRAADRAAVPARSAGRVPRPSRPPRPADGRSRPRPIRRRRASAGSGFARRLAEAILAPGRAASRAAARESGSRHRSLSQRFVLRPSRVMARLATLGANGASGLPPAFLIVLDASGASAGAHARRRISHCRGSGRSAQGCRSSTACGTGEVAAAELDLPDGGRFRAVVAERRRSRDQARLPRAAAAGDDRLAATEGADARDGTPRDRSVSPAGSASGSTARTESSLRSRARRAFRARRGPIRPRSHRLKRPDSAP